MPFITSSCLLLILVLSATLPYFPIAKGQFLFDDYGVILTNKSLWDIETLKDAFYFVLKPSKPVSNFFLALGHLLGSGTLGQRLLSYFFHALTGCLLFWNLNTHLKKKGITCFSRFAFWCSLLFVLSPIHTESIGVALFRMDVMGTCFTLLALLATESWSKKDFRWSSPWMLVVFLFLGLAIGSKEVFAVFTPLTLFLFYGDSLKKKTLFLQLLWMEVFWVSQLLLLLQSDARSEYPYSDVLGRGVLSFEAQVSLGARSLLEGIVKSVTGWNLTTVRLSDRQGIASHWPLWAHSLVWVSALGVSFWLGLKNAWLRIWVGIWALGVFLYLLIPNLNIGSEHYWYFPSLGWWTLLVGAWANISRKFFLHSQRVFEVVLVGVSLMLCTSTLAQVRHMKTRLEYYLSDLHKHPESVVPWNNVAVAILESQHPNRFEMAKPFVEKALSLAPHYPNVQFTRFFYHFGRQDKENAKEALSQIEKLLSHDPQKLSRYYHYFGLIGENTP